MSRQLKYFSSSCRLQLIMTSNQLNFVDSVIPNICRDRSSCRGATGNDLISLNMSKNIIYLLHFLIIITSLLCCDSLVWGKGSWFTISASAGCNMLSSRGRHAPSMLVFIRLMLPKNCFPPRIAE